MVMYRFDVKYMYFRIKCYFLFSVTPLADYYISAGVVYQAPDLGSVVNSRMVSRNI